MQTVFLKYFFPAMTVGATYALAVLSFTLIYATSKVTHVEPGEFIMRGGVLAVFFTHAGLPMLVALLLAIAAPALVCMLEKQMVSNKFVSRKKYTRTKVAILPWLNGCENQGVDWADAPRLKDWFDLIRQHLIVQCPRSPTTRRTTPCYTERSTKDIEERQRVVFVWHQEGSRDGA